MNKVDYCSWMKRCLSWMSRGVRRLPGVFGVSKQPLPVERVASYGATC